MKYSRQGKLNNNSFQEDFEGGTITTRFDKKGNPIDIIKFKGKAAKRKLPLNK